MRLFIISLLCGTSLLLTGCAPSEPEYFGVKQSQWQTLSPDQQNQVIQAYNEQQLTKEKQKPLMMTLSTMSDLAMTSSK